MGKITKFTLVKEESQLGQLKTGPISVLMGATFEKLIRRKLNQRKSKNQKDNFLYDFARKQAGFSYAKIISVVANWLTALAW